MPTVKTAKMTIENTKKTSCGAGNSMDPPRTDGEASPRERNPRYAEVDSYSIDASIGFCYAIKNNLKKAFPAWDVCRSCLRHVLGLFGGNITRTAEALRIAPNTLRNNVSGEM